MDPGQDNGSSRGIADPPLFDPDQDLQVWRKRVAAWVDLISTAAEKGSDKLYKTIFATLARQLYDRGLRQAQKSIVEEAQERGDIDYKQEDQVKGVEQIVNLIAVDPPISVVTRLIDSFNKVTSCRRRQSENLNHFVSRFRGLAAEHLMRAGTTQSSQIGEVLAITLLNNADLPEGTLTNSKLQLISLARSHCRGKDQPVVLPSQDADTLIQTGKRVKNLLEDAKIYRSYSRSRVIETFAKLRSGIRKAQEESEAALKRLDLQNNNKDNRSITKGITMSGPRCILRLDDAVSVVQSLAQTTKRADTHQPITKTQMQTAVSKEVRSFLAINSAIRNPQPYIPKGKRNTSDRLAESHPSRPIKMRKTSEQKPRSTLSDLCGNQCLDCGSSNHKRGDKQ